MDNINLTQQVSLSIFGFHITSAFMWYYSALKPQTYLWFKRVLRFATLSLRTADVYHFGRRFSRRVKQEPKKPDALAGYATLDA